MSQQVTFAHNFGGRASATEFSSIVVTTEGNRVLHTVAEPSEFRVRENGTVTIYSRRHKSTSVYGITTKGRHVVGIRRKDSRVVVLSF